MKTTWYKCDSSVALEAARALTLEERGAYFTLYNLVFDRDGDVPDDDRFIAGWMGCEIRVWRRLKSSLIGRGNVIQKNGILAIPRAGEELEIRRTFAERSSNAGRTAAKKRWKNNESEMRDPMHNNTYKVSEEKRKDSKILDSPAALLKKESSVVDFPTEALGFTSEDGTINFTAADFELLSAECPLVENVRGTVINLAATDWIARKVAPYDRNRAIRAKIKKLQRVEAEKQKKLVTPKQVAAVNAIDKDRWDAEYEERQKALAVRNRILGKR